VKISHELKVGLIFIVAVAIFVWGLNFLKGTDILSEQKFLYAVYDEIDGLEKDNKVMINGLNIGQVNSLGFFPGSSKIVAKLYIKRDIKIPKNSIARIYSVNLLGGKAVEILLGDGIEATENGDTLISKMETSLREQVNEQVEPLKKKAVALINSVDSVITVIQSIFNENTRVALANSIQNIHLTLSNLESATSNFDNILKKEKYRISSIITNLDSISYNL
jgi:phospholipid/cholesterol/gamma-HCH transport system substrate-binding protein